MSTTDAHFTDAHFTVVTDLGQPDCLVKAEGEIDLYCATAFTEALAEALAVTPARVVVDMADVTFIDSTGLGVLVAALKRGATTGTPVALRAPTTKTVRLLELTALDQLFQVIDR
jgi:anti-sigma B factor antagonist